MVDEDIYFLNAQEALRVATEQNRWGDNNIYLQACYYEGDIIESELENLIHLPIDNLVESLSYGTNRLPSKVDFTGLELSAEIELNITINFNISIQKVKHYRAHLYLQYFNEMKNSKLDFSERLRVYIAANASTSVMQYVSKHIADEFKKKGCDVKFRLYIGIEDNVNVSEQFRFNPHITLNINHLNNASLHDDCFNFIWFQDPMNAIAGNSRLELRSRDYLFHLTRTFKDMILDKGQVSTYQPFCMNTDIFKARNEITKEKKIVFIGSSYSDRIKNIKGDEHFAVVYQDALEIFEQKSCLTAINHKESDIQYLMNKHNKTSRYINDVYGYIMRDYCVEKLCSIDTDFIIEVYGPGWDNNDIVKPYLKGKIEYGEEISKIYNSAMYGYCPGGYILMQRTLECAFSETVALVLDTRADMEDEYNEKLEASIELFHIKDLELILSKSDIVQKEYDYIKQEYSYSKFVEHCLSVVSEDK